jgi:hypothetical protein
MRDDTRHPQAGLPPPPCPAPAGPDAPDRCAVRLDAGPPSRRIPARARNFPRRERLAGPPPSRTAGPRYDIRLRCDLDAVQAARLGDRLVRALSEGVGRIVLWIEGTRPPSAEAACLVNSLGRHMAREDDFQGVEMRGQGPAFHALVAAFRQGQAGAASAREGRS